MKPSTKWWFIKNPRFQKWSLFTSLVVSLGFNLSMNPQLANIARNEMHTMDLAQTAAAVPSALSPLPTVNPADPNLFGVLVNLGEKTDDDRFKNYGVVVTLNITGDKISYILKKKKSDSEGYSSEACEECGRKSLEIPVGFNKDNKAHMQVIFAKIAEEEQKNLKKVQALAATADKEKEKEKSEDKKGLGMFDPSCRDKADDDIMDCQYQVISAMTEKCSKWDRKCESDLKAKFKPFTELFKACASSGSISKSRLRIAEDMDCDDAKEMAENMLEDMPSDFALKRASAFLQTNLTNNSAQYRARLIKQRVDPFQAAELVKSQFDYSARIAGNDVLRRLQTNDRFKSISAANSFFTTNFYDGLDQVRTDLFKNPLAYTYPELNENGQTGGLTPPDLSKYRAVNIRSAGQVEPVPPVDSIQPGTAVPAVNSVGRTQPTSAPVSNGLLSPAQRGQSTLRQ